MVKLLLQFKADPKLRTISSLYPLPLAVSKEERDIVELLLDNKADPNISGGNALFQALDSNPTSKTMAEIVQLLAGHGANLEVTNSIGQTPLLLGATQLKSEIAKILLEHGANPNARELEFGNSPLHWAVIHADTNLVFLLLAKKADVNEQNRFGVTPLELAKTGLTGQIQLKLYSNGGGYFDVDKPAMAEIARLLRDHGAIEDFPRLTRIAINRLFETPQTVFQKDTNNWNHFNLMEVIEHCSWGRIPAAVPGGAQLPPHGPAYPDFSRLIIHRLDRASTNSEKQIVVNLLNATNEFDCAKNTWLEFGDIVEIPERDHALSEQWIGLPGSQGSELANCVSRKVRLLVRGQTKEIMIYGSYLSDTLRDTEARSVLLSSSDLSRIKVKHHDPLTGKTMEFTIDETKASPPNDLWLRDGDVIEVPEK